MTDKSFVLNDEHIFVNPATLETSLMYVPMEVAPGTFGSFKAFVTDVIVKTAQIDDENSDNFVQRILNAMKREPFRIREFDELLSSAINIKNAEPPHATKTDSDHGYKVLDNDLIDSRNISIGSKQKEKKKSRENLGGNAHIKIGIVQVIAVIALIISFLNILPSISENGAIDPISAGMIVFIVGAIVFGIGVAIADISKPSKRKN